jgi:hypothetical protein
MEVQVRIDGLPFVSAEDWTKAQAAPASESPSVEPKELAQRMQLPPDSDARSEFAYSLAREIIA